MSKLVQESKRDIELDQIKIYHQYETIFQKKINIPKCDRIPLYTVKNMQVNIPRKLVSGGNKG